jgi:hypothetical protein
MMRTFWRLITNQTLMCNNLASVFYFLGYMPYWVFMAKYIETQYRQSASTSSLITGKVLQYLDVRRVPEPQLYPSIVLQIHTSVKPFPRFP